MGKNKTFIYNKLPHINKLLKNNFTDFIKDIEVLVISIYDEELNQYLNYCSDEIEIIDLIRISGHKNGGKYEGICW